MGNSTANGGNTLQKHLIKIGIGLLCLTVLAVGAFIGLIEYTARQGRPEARTELGRWNETGIWLHPTDVEAATHWYSLAANAGYAPAQYNLGLLMEQSKNYQKAAYWYLRAALQNYPAAQNNLAVFYSKGLVLTKSDEKAVNWFKRAAEQGDKYAQYSLGLAYANGRGIEKNEQLAVYWVKKAAEQDFAPAQGYMAILYAKGEGVPQNSDTAMEWAKSAKHNNDINADRTIKLIEELKLSKGK